MTQIDSEQLFRYLPAPPETFDDAVAMVLEAKEAISYWEKRTHGWNRLENDQAKLMKKRWKAYLDKSQQVVDSYQTRMF